MTAEAWLWGILAEGPMETAEIMTAAKAAGYTRGEIKNARRTLGAKVTNDRNRSRPPRKWYWSLPEAKI